MLNLNAGLITGDDAAYEKAERIFWNALAFNQWINGGFGHRGLTANGYGMNLFEEAWWCCVHDGGLAMSEYARHAVTFCNGAIRVNLWVPGVPAAPGEDRAWRQPGAAATGTIEMQGAAEMPIRVRIAMCGGGKVTETRSGEGRWS